MGYHIKECSIQVTELETCLLDRAAIEYLGGRGAREGLWAGAVGDLSSRERSAPGKASVGCHAVTEHNNNNNNNYYYF